ncbi:hypothetical protein [Brucella sp. NF 2653]|uniref:hypothetical protein n=1 Tax=Brucella sp. NF 2653 TaxID=693748 RepID=UPI000319D571|nr:hypothetical protein [Brucella sp. NF 2653]
MLKTLILCRRYLCAVRLSPVNSKNGILKRQRIIIAIGSNCTDDEGLGGESKIIGSRLEGHSIALNSGIHPSSATNTARYRTVIDDGDICAYDTGTALRTGAMSPACSDTPFSPPLTCASSAARIGSRIPPACATGYGSIVCDRNERTITNNIHARTTAAAARILRIVRPDPVPTGPAGHGRAIGEICGGYNTGTTTTAASSTRRSARSTPAAFPTYDNGIVGYFRRCYNARTTATATITPKSILVRTAHTSTTRDIGINGRGRGDYTTDSTTSRCRIIIIETDSTSPTYPGGAISHPSRKNHLDLHSAHHNPLGHPHKPIRLYKA